VAADQRTIDGRRLPVVPADDQPGRALHRLGPQRRQLQGKGLRDLVPCHQLPPGCRGAKKVRGVAADVVVARNQPARAQPPRNPANPISVYCRNFLAILSL